MFVSFYLKVKRVRKIGKKESRNKIFSIVGVFFEHKNHSVIINSQIINKKKHVNEKQKKAMNRARFSFIYSFVRGFING